MELLDDAGSRTRRPMHPGLARAAIAVVLVALAGCGERGSETRAALRAGLEAIREPSADALRASGRFSGAGLTFDYPAALREQHVQEDGDDVWSLAYGLYEMELYVSDAEPTAAAYLDGLATEFGKSRSSELVHPPRPGRRLTLCGQRIESLVLRVKLLGDESLYESFDLPPAADARARLLTISYEPVGGRPPALAAAAEAALLRSLRCDGAAGPQKPPAAPDAA